ncbi:MAG: nucleoside phosphorylase [Crenarchaeota archaeon]|nr:nucleoside phosphorylase [Thermoproteota archaeon]
METKNADASIIALAGGSAYVEAVTAMLCLSSVEKIYAMGWCGSLDEEIRPGDILIAYAAVRGDGTTSRYADPEYPAVADPIYVIDLYHKLRTYGLRPKLSIIYTTSTHLREKEILEKWKGKAQCIECEVSVLYVISRLLGIPSVAALVVSDTLVHKYRDVYSTVNVAEKLLKILVEIIKEH